ncbi:MFS transporter [Nocardioides pocheonensis]|uniref:MFS transporter n=1 Tax=Nocardioides pocheonensis TaxID=661485 RepID=A0A3N0GK13_9ACTN|nr:MFS transporter [Nocardioides pocheonensis]RNM12803.1 MFS transporter [Nocardioides pocheonensis]
MTTTLSGTRRGFFRRLIPPTPMSRRLATQSMLFSTGEGAFNTGSAVFLTQVVGMSAARVGLALTITGVAEFLMAYPAGRFVDRFGPKRVWSLATWGRAACFLALPFVGSFGEYLVVGLLFALAASSGHSSYQSYVLDALPTEERIDTQAYMYSALNVGFTFGAILGGVALAFDNLTVVRWTPWFAAVLMAFTAWWISRLPQAPHDLRVASGEARVRPPGPGALRNPGWMLVTFFNGTLWTNQVLLNVVIPLWLVEATDAPHVLLAWLFGTNTVLCIFLPAYTSKGVRDLRDAVRYVRISSAFFVASCLITMVTHSTVGLVTVLLVWLGHVTVTGAELFISGASWSFQAELMDPRRRGEYQGVQDVSRTLGSMWAPALYTYLAMSRGDQGWLAIAGIIVVATVAIGPSVRLAERFAVRHFPADQVDRDAGDDALPETLEDTGQYAVPEPAPPAASSTQGLDLT